MFLLYELFLFILHYLLFYVYYIISLPVSTVRFIFMFLRYEYLFMFLLYNFFFCVYLISILHDRR